MSLVGFHIRITPELRERIEIGRLAQTPGRPMAAPSTQEFVASLIEAGLAVYHQAPVTTAFANGRSTMITGFAWGQQQDPVHSGAVVALSTSTK